MAGYPFFKLVREYPWDIERPWTDQLQGVTHDETYWYMTQKGGLWKFPVTMDLNSERAPIKPAPIPPELADDYNHMGDLDYHGGLLFVSFENTEDGIDRVPRLGIFDASSLDYLSSVEVPRQGKKAPWAAINPVNGLLYSSLDDGVKCLFAYAFNIEGDQLLLNFDHTCDLIGLHGTPLNLNSVQGAVFTKDNLLFLASNSDDTGRGVFVFQMPGCRQTQFIPIASEPWYENAWEEVEGITYWDLDSGRAPGIRGQLHVLEADNDYVEIHGAAGDLKCFKHYRRCDSRFVANRNPASREVHRWDCDWIDRMSARNKVPYNSLRHAINDGYDGCHYCLGDYDNR